MSDDNENRFAPFDGLGTVPPSKEILAALQDQSERAKANPAYARLFVRFANENPTIMGARSSMELIDFMNRWCELPETIDGEFQRRTLRREVRERFPILPQQLELCEIQCSKMLESLRNHQWPNVPHTTATKIMQNFYSTFPWFGFTDCPEPPTTTLTAHQLVPYATRLLTFIQVQTEKLNTSPKPAATISAAKADAIADSVDPCDAARARLRDALSRYLNGTAAIVHLSTSTDEAAELKVFGHAAIMYRVNGSPQYPVIATRNYSNKGGEFDAICGFFNYIEAMPHMLWILWRNEPLFGIAQVRQRGNYLKREPEFGDVAVPIFDVNEHLQDIYGEKYAPDPKMSSTFRLNNISPANLLTAEECAAAYEHEDHGRLELNTIARAKCIEGVLRRAAKDELIVTATSVQQSGSTNAETTTASASPTDIASVPEMLSTKEAKVLAIIKSLAPSTAIKGPDLQEEINRDLGWDIDQGTFSRLIKKLKSHGVRNKPRIGYFYARARTMTWSKALPYSAHSNAYSAHKNKLLCAL